MDRTNGRSKIKGIPRTKTHWVLMEKQLNSSGKIRTGFTTLTVLKEIQMDLESKNIEPENFKDRIILMSMFNDIEWKKEW